MSHSKLTSLAHATGLSASSDMAEFFRNTSAMSETHVLFLAVAPALSRNEVFDIVADAGLHNSGWWRVWKMAIDRTEAAVEAVNTGRAWRACMRASDAVAAAAVALYLGVSLPEGDYDRLIEPWMEATARAAFVDAVSRV